MKFRHEEKFIINYCDYLTLRSRLRRVLPFDEHTDAGGQYRIRSIYFDTPGDLALRQKLDGVNRREKFRIRFYNLDLSFIRLEKKSKLNSLCCKEEAALSCQEAKNLLSGSGFWMTANSSPLIQDFYQKWQHQCLRPKIIVDYIREPFLYHPGNVRITLDHHIRTSKDLKAALTDSAVTLPCGCEEYLLEVKYDEFLPNLIRDLVQLDSRRMLAFSKYAECRRYG